MTSPSAGRETLSRAQFDAVKAALPTGVGLDRYPAEPVAPDVVWEANHVLVGDEIKGDDAALRGLGATMTGGNQEARPGYVKRWQLPPNISTEDALRQLNRIERFQGRVFRNYLVSICPVNLCPADEPTLPPGTTPRPVPAPGTAGRGVRVRVIDTGLADRWWERPWLTRPEVDGVEYPPVDPIPLYGGHGTFIAGVLRCVAPGVSVKVTDELRWAGAATEFDIRNAILDAVNGPLKPHIIVLSAGCTTLDGQPPKALTEAVQRMNQPGCTTLLVAAAGNDGLGPDGGVRRQFYPAAFADSTIYSDYAKFVVAVGALRGDRNGRACFSNYENWVSVYEDGERLVNAFAYGKYTHQEPLPASGNPAKPYCLYYGPPPVAALYPKCTCVTAPGQGAAFSFDGLATWSGTSFSTPIVAARVARIMTDTDNPRQKWQSLKPEIETVPDAGGGATLRRFRVPVTG